MVLVDRAAGSEGHSWCSSSGGRDGRRRERAGGRWWGRTGWRDRGRRRACGGGWCTRAGGEEAKGWREQTAGDRRCVADGGRRFAGRRRRRRRAGGWGADGWGRSGRPWSAGRCGGRRRRWVAARLELVAAGWTGYERQGCRLARPVLLDAGAAPARGCVVGGGPYSLSDGLRRGAGGCPCGVVLSAGARRPGPRARRAGSGPTARRTRGAGRRGCGRRGAGSGW
jgi:hypothetical protein